MSQLADRRPQMSVVLRCDSRFIAAFPRAIAQTFPQLRPKKAERCHFPPRTSQLTLSTPQTRRTTRPRNRYRYRHRRSISQLERGYERHGETLLRGRGQLTLKGSFERCERLNYFYAITLPRKRRMETLLICLRQLFLLLRAVSQPKTNATSLIRCHCLCLFHFVCDAQMSFTAFLGCLSIGDVGSAAIVQIWRRVDMPVKIIIQTSLFV